jgi:hypothetical protein
MGNVKLSNFLGPIKARPLVVSAKFPFVDVPSEVEYDRSLVQGLLGHAEREFRQGNFEASLSLGYYALFSLAAAPFVRPRSARDSDPDAERLLLFIRLSSLLDKAAGWLGVSDVGPLSAIDIGRDIRKAYKVLGDDESAGGALSIQAYYFLRRGDFRSAQSILREGLATVKGRFATRALLGAEAKLRARWGHYHAARRLYEVCWRTDMARSDEVGAALARGELAILSAKVERARKNRWIERAASEVATLKSLGHRGFELQTRQALAEYFAEEQEYGETERIVSEILAELPGTDARFGSIRRRASTLKRYSEAGLEYRAGRSIFLLDSLEGKRHFKRTRVTHDEYLESTFDALNQFLLEGKLVKGIEQLCLAVERVTTILIKELNMIGNEDVRIGGLPEKNEILYEAGIYGQAEFDRIAHLVQIRNQVLHGDIEGIYLARLYTLSALAEASGWLFRLVKELGIGPGSAEGVEFKRQLPLFRN